VKRNPVRGGGVAREEPPTRPAPPAAIIQGAIARTWVAVSNVNVTWREGCPTTGTERFVKVQIGRNGMVPDGRGGMYYDHSTDGQTRGLGMAALCAPTTAPADLFGTLGMTFWVEDNGGSVAPRMEYVAVHEFGHVLGFAHEQERAEQEARACGPAVAGGINVGPYDPESVMNYCNHYGNYRGVLSEGDVAGARQLYGGAGDRRNAFADLTGDGRADGVAVNTDATYVALSSGAALGAVGRWSGAFYGTRETLFGDVNGDGRADLVAVGGTETRVRLSTGSGFAAAARWSGAFYGVWATAFADVNGDRRADAIAVNDDAVYVMTSSGSAFVGYRAWSSIPFYGTRDTLFADLTGDGRADAVAVNDDGDYVLTSTGSSLAWAGRWSGPFYSQR